MRAGDAGQDLRSEGETDPKDVHMPGSTPDARAAQPATLPEAGPPMFAEPVAPAPEPSAHLSRGISSLSTIPATNEEIVEMLAHELEIQMAMPKPPVPPLPSFRGRTESANAGDKDGEPEVSQATIEARKQYWARWKVPKNQSQTLVLSSSSVETLNYGQPGANATPGAALPKEDVTSAEGLVSANSAEAAHAKAGHGLNEPNEGVPAAPSAPSVQAPNAEPGPAGNVETTPGQPAPSNEGSDHVAEALKRLTTVDLENGAAPSSFSGLTLGPVLKTHVWMDVGGTRVPVEVPLQPEVCKAAGLQLVSETQPEVKPDASPANTGSDDKSLSQPEVKRDASPIPLAPPPANAGSDAKSLSQPEVKPDASPIPLAPPPANAGSDAKSLPAEAADEEEKACIALVL